MLLPIIDNASYFSSRKVKARMAQRKVVIHFASPFDPRTNPFAERYGGVLVPSVRALLFEGCYPPKFWSVLLCVAAWLQNRMVRQSGFAAYELFCAGKIDLEKEPILDFSKVHPTGTLCYWNVQKAASVTPSWEMLLLSAST